MALGEAVRRVAKAIDRRACIVRAPVFVHYVLAWCFEKTMKIPLVSVAQVRILSEGIVEPLPACEKLPADLLPERRFAAEQIRAGLPEPAAFGLKDLRWFV